MDLSRLTSEGPGRWEPVRLATVASWKAPGYPAENKGADGGRRLDQAV